MVITKEETLGLQAIFDTEQIFETELELKLDIIGKVKLL